ncbi:MAG TPA: hypothetical protein PKE44_02875, partial [Plasticicumulans sp.]|nr:hypothetical protein [Plasticicumulans sp.]
MAGLRRQVHGLGDNIARRAWPPGGRWKGGRDAAGSLQLRATRRLAVTVLAAGAAAGFFAAGALPAATVRAAGFAAGLEVVVTRAAGFAAGLAELGGGGLARLVEHAD